MCNLLVCVPTLQSQANRTSFHYGKLSYWEIKCRSQLSPWEPVVSGNTSCGLMYRVAGTSLMYQININNKACFPQLHLDSSEHFDCVIVVDLFSIR